jgi:hypothetical protein
VDGVAPSPNQLLSRLVGDRMYSVEFVLNDYVQFRFDGAQGAPKPVTLNVYVWPIVERDGRAWRETDLGYADALRRLVPGVVSQAAGQTADGIRITLDTGVIHVHPSIEEVYVEIAQIMGFEDDASMTWWPGDHGFEDVV